jgi:hypothetical protein
VPACSRLKQDAVDVSKTWAKLEKTRKATGVEQHETAPVARPAMSFRRRFESLDLSRPWKSRTEFNSRKER